MSCNLLTKDIVQRFPVQFPLPIIKKFRTCVRFIKESLQEMLHYTGNLKVDFFPVYDIVSCIWHADIGTRFPLTLEVKM